MIYFSLPSYPLEMQMIHIENDFISKSGKIKIEKAYESPVGVAILSVLFKIQDSKPQVTD